MESIDELRWKGSPFASALRWKVNHWIAPRLALLNQLGSWITIFSAFQAPGDTLLAGIICRNLKQRFPNLKINCLTANPTVLHNAPYLDAINARESYFSIWFSYTGVIDAKDGETNVLKPIFDSLGIRDFDYHAKVHLTREELEEGGRLLGASTLPLLSFNLLSKERVKNWPLSSWHPLLGALASRFDLVHLGDDREPLIPGVRRFAGKLSLRQSMAVMAHSRLHIGPDSFLMHAANGLDVPSIVIFGGSRTPANLGYAANVNLFAEVPCGPCYIHDSLGQICQFQIMCMDKISVQQVLSAVQKIEPNPESFSGSISK